MGKKTLAIVGLTRCTGCLVSFLDMEENLFDVFDNFDLQYCTTLLDAKTYGKVDVCVVEGCVGNEHDVATVKEAREKSKVLVTLGSCACFGGINALRNLFTTEAVLHRSYVQSETTVRGVVPTDVPQLMKEVKPVTAYVSVDYQIPGCPPVPDMIRSGLEDVLKGRPLQEPTKNLCSECHRRHDRMLIPQRELLSFELLNPFEVDDLDDDLCFLEQGVVCLGPATKAGCGGRCLSVDMPCRGCMGPPRNQHDHGCTTVNALASMLPIGLLAEQEDLMGLAYRFSLGYSTITAAADGQAKRKEEEDARK